MKHKKAFTIIEFVLAMGLFSTMLLMIAVLTIRITGIYQKGLSIRSVNAVGRELIDDITKIVQSSPIQESINPEVSSSGNVTASNIVAKRSEYFTYYTGSDQTKQETQGKTQSSGLFCTGSYTYIWNTAQTLTTFENNDDAITITNETGKHVYKFIRVPDYDRSYCAKFNEDKASNRTFEIAEDQIVNLINDDESDLAIYDFTVLPATQSDTTGHALYPISFILATKKGGINILSNGDYCSGQEVPSDLNSEDSEYNSIDFNYCAVNKFDFVVRQTGEAEDVNGYGSR